MPRKCLVQRHPVLQAKQSQSSHLWRDLRATHEDIRLIHRVWPNIPSGGQLGHRWENVVWRTSGYFEQILETAARTSSCSGVNPDVSIMRRAPYTENHRDGCAVFEQMMLARGDVTTRARG